MGKTFSVAAPQNDMPPTRYRGRPWRGCREWWLEDDWYYKWDSRSREYLGFRNGEAWKWIRQETVVSWKMFRHVRLHRLKVWSRKVIVYDWWHVRSEYFCPKFKCFEDEYVHVFSESSTSESMGWVFR